MRWPFRRTRTRLPVIGPATFIRDLHAITVPVSRTEPPSVPPARPPKPRRSRDEIRRQGILLVSLLALLGSAVVWSYLGARLHAGNADQLIDGYLFESRETLAGAQFPATHTFLFKWPLFALGALLGNGSLVLIVLTVCSVVLTVGALAYLLHKIVGNPLRTSGLYAVMAIALLLVPTQPYAGALLPVNMAMLTTRNLEYILFILPLVVLIRLRRRTALPLAMLLLGLLFASDRLFLPLSFGGALLVLMGGALLRAPQLRHLGMTWLLSSVGGVLLMFLMLGAITATGTADLVYGGKASPYQIASPGQMVLGAVYAGLGLLSQLGMNPGFDAKLLGELPARVAIRLFSPLGVAYVLVGSMVLAVFAWVVTAARRWLREPQRPRQLSGAAQLSIALIATTLVAVVIFIATDHYYFVDARYVTIGFFAVCVTAATMLRTYSLPEDWSRLWLLGLAVGLTVALSGSYQLYAEQHAALQPLARRDAAVARILADQPGRVLIGDYWRVVPIKARTGGSQRILPLQSCTAPSQALTSSSWNLKAHETFAYLYSAEKGATDYPRCYLQDIVARYGMPSSTALIAGSPTDPREMLLLYDTQRATFEAQPRNGERALADMKPEASCTAGTTMTVVAHPDDDILFTNPALQDAINAGRCVRSIYLTAGDSGGDLLYWAGRQSGTMAAYEHMSGRSLAWQTTVVHLPSGQYATFVQSADGTMSLVFLHLPDGNLSGEGFPAYQGQSLRKLQYGDIPRMQTVDGRSGYGSADLVEILSAMMVLYGPDTMFTMADIDDAAYPDHSDHMAVNFFAHRAAEHYTAVYGGVIQSTDFVGYPVQGRPENVFDVQRASKESAFMAYARYDHGVCQTLEACYAGTSYGSYLLRQYTMTDFLFSAE